MTSKAILEAERLLLTDEYEKALRELDSVDVSSLGSNDYGYYCILYAEATLYAGHDRDVSSLIEHAIEAFRYGAETEKFARAMFLKGWWLISQGKYAEAGCPTACCGFRAYYQTNPFLRNLFPRNH